MVLGSDFAYISGMLWRSSRGKPLNVPAAFIHRQPIVAKQPPFRCRPRRYGGAKGDKWETFATDVICNTDCQAAPSHISNRISSGDITMRMPILTYFLVVSVILFGGMRLVSSQLEAKPLPVSQRIGVPAPFKAPPDATR